MSVTFFYLTQNVFHTAPYTVTSTNTICQQLNRLWLGLIGSNLLSIYLFVCVFSVFFGPRCLWGKQAEVGSKFLQCLSRHPLSNLASWYLPAPRRIGHFHHVGSLTGLCATVASRLSRSQITAAYHCFLSIFFYFSLQVEYLLLEILRTRIVSFLFKYFMYIMRDLVSETQV